MENIQFKIDRVLKDFWINVLPKEYNNDNLLKEDSLKCLMYYHLRTHLSDAWLNRHRIRIYPEFILTPGKRADIAIVQLIPAAQRADKHLSNCVEKVSAIIELKYKSADVADDFYADVKKLHDYSKLFPDSQLYAGFIHEERYNDANCSWFDGRQTSKWAKGRVAEMLGYWDEATDSFTTKVIAYNENKEAAI
ncbi:hypothetical protein [Ruminiclostridium josui]|uniref:hypothetical protein n=1 Tax=Ruminiclostridium josui TaxID=1499 RepID=UPI0004678F14|nr:hypothetical protein [Ruminiclostridium josui]